MPVITRQAGRAAKCCQQKCQNGWMETKAAKKRVLGSQWDPTFKSNNGLKGRIKRTTCKFTLANALDLQSATLNNSLVGPCGTVWNMHRTALCWLRGRWHTVFKCEVLRVAVEATWGSAFHIHEKASKKCSKLRFAGDWVAGFGK